MSDRPERPLTDRPEDLNFVPLEKMVRWLAPRQLLGTALRVVLSQVFGAYSDKREIQASLPAPDPCSYAELPEMWFDFVSDMGDAFGPTYTVASLLAQEQLEIAATTGAGSWNTPRGRVLVMGGDQTYPTASVGCYENQLVGPYRAALPYWEGDPLDLYVVPGNHDWYDGLTAFMRVFCRQQWIGGWRTRQTRSYFAAELPHRWWLWGVDVQLDSYIDEPQFRYFDQAAARLAEGDSIILCSPAPSWIRGNSREHPEAYVTLDYFERKVIRPRGAVVRLGLTGDLHHYARYVEVGGGRQKITAGGGGAFLSETHNLPPEIVVPPPHSRDSGKTEPPARYRLATTFPDAPTSRRLRWRVVLLPFMNPSFWVFIGGAYLAYAGMIQAAARSVDRFSVVMAQMSYVDMVRGVARSPLAVLATLALAGGLIGFTKSKVAAKKWPLGLAHTLAQLLVIFLVIGVSAAVASGLSGPGTGFVVVFVALVGVVGGLLGSWVMAGYLLVADKFGLNGNELFAAQHNGDYKCFLRLHIGPEGGLTVYPVGVKRSPRRWKLRAGGKGNEPWFEPADGLLTPHLIEEPIRIEAGPPAT